MLNYLNVKMKKGFTLIETIVTVVVFTLIIGVVISLVLVLYNAYEYTWRQTKAVYEAQRGIETMVKQIRKAKAGDDGSFAIQRAGDKEFIFFSNINEDDNIERVRYFLGNINLGTKIEECQTLNAGGFCTVSFSNFLQGELISAEIKVLIRGDFGWDYHEYAILNINGHSLGKICETGCSDCPNILEGTQVFDVTNFAKDNFISFIIDASNNVNMHENCLDYAMEVKFEFSWTEELPGSDGLLKKGIIYPVGHPPQYPLDQEIITTLSSYVRNMPPIFRYFDGDGNRLIETPARLKDTRLMEVYLVINVNPKKIYESFELKSTVQLRNLKR